MKIENDTVVSIAYTLTSDDGEKLDGTTKEAPLKYLHGHRNIIEGLEKALADKKAGDKVQVKVAPEQAYGDIQPELISKAPRSAFEGIDDIQVGMQFEAEAEDGHVDLVTISEVGEKEVTVNGNHPLAGQNLNFDVEIIDVVKGTETEVKDGFPSGVQ